MTAMKYGVVVARHGYDGGNIVGPFDTLEDAQNRATTFREDGVEDAFVATWNEQPDGSIRVQRVAPEHLDGPPQSE